MGKKWNLFFGIFLLITALVQPVFAQEGETEDPPTEETGDGQKFQSRDRLLETLLAGTGGGGGDDGEDPPTDEPPTDGGGTGGGDGENNEEPPPLGDEEKAQQFVDSLTDEQVVAFNRSLNNAVNSGLEIEFLSDENWDLLQKAVDDEYNPRQINSLTKALETEAKFTALAEKTGNDKFLEKASGMKEKFLGKIEKMAKTGKKSGRGGDDDEGGEEPPTDEPPTDDGDTGGTDLASVETERPGKGVDTSGVKEAVQAAKAARMEARNVAKDARDAAKAASKDVRDAAKSGNRDAMKAAREAAKEARLEARQASRDARDAAKAVTREIRTETQRVAKEARDNAKNEAKNENKGKGNNGNKGNNGKGNSNKP